MSQHHWIRLVIYWVLTMGLMLIVALWRCILCVTQGSLPFGGLVLIVVEHSASESVEATVHGRLLLIVRHHLMHLHVVSRRCYSRTCLTREQGTCSR